METPQAVLTEIMKTNYRVERTQFFFFLRATKLWEHAGVSFHHLVDVDTDRSMTGKLRSAGENVVCREKQKKIVAHTHTHRERQTYRQWSILLCWSVDVFEEKKKRVFRKTIIVLVNENKSFLSTSTRPTPRRWRKKRNKKGARSASTLHNALRRKKKTFV